MKAIKSLHSIDPILNRVQDNILQGVSGLLKSPIADAQLLPSVSLSTGTNTINHRLGRALQGWIIVRNNANVTVYDSQTTNALPDKTLVLVASGAATVSLLVF